MTESKTVLSAVGVDQPGVVATLCDVLTQKGCNITNMTQTNIENQFASLFILEKLTNLTKEELKKSLEAAVIKAGLRIGIDLYDCVKPDKEPEPTEPFVVSIYGSDRKSILGTFAKIFAAHRINIDDLRGVQFQDTDCMLVYEVQIPKNTDLKAFQQEILTKAQSMNLNATVQHRDIFEAIHRIQVF